MKRSGNNARLVFPDTLQADMVSRVRSTDIFMATLREIREEAGFSVSELAKRAEVDYKTTKKADESGGSIHRLKALALLQVLNQELGTEHTLEDIDGLTLH